MKAIDSIWFSDPLGCFGLVVGENDVGERKLYAGVVSGFDRKVDEQALLDYGNQINLGMLKGLIAKTEKSNP